MTVSQYSLRLSMDMPADNFALPNAAPVGAHEQGRRSAGFDHI